MFTGIVEERGEVLRLGRSSDHLRLRIRSDVVSSDSAVGSSISVNGCCLTVTDLGDGWWETVAVAETLSRTTMGGLSVGDLVNLERALLATARIDGHIVQGHVDATAAVMAVDELEHDARRLVVEMPEAIAAYIVEKGSIALDGVSLTVASLDTETFDVAIIPHTAAATTLGSLEQGSRVNVETDCLARHIERLIEVRLGGKTSTAVAAS